ncbi:hypothetical protein LshimejAT787_1402920 [Lyophyllum shimeji]|uniref:DUF6534 domain-containing protein n=1 Tax=Lyophyllum shimeji TaxID=47721 RepID=A0A9P3UTM8_LYOSH|nr:hypothetical protein LshimejAT787_1402920 [Lyophyllum shimeji]
MVISIGGYVRLAGSSKRQFVEFDGISCTLLRCSFQMGTRTGFGDVLHYRRLVAFMKTGMSSDHASFRASFPIVMAPVDVPKTFGALLLGGLFAAVLSGVVTVQIIVYFKLYPGDGQHLKALVLFIWFLDTCHTSFIWAALWEYLISYFGAEDKIDFIPWNIALTVVFTAVLTFAVHCFFAHRIFKLSRRKWTLTIPIIFLAVLRLASACATTGTMIHLHSFTAFKDQFRWLFTLGLALSSGVDILITCSLFFLLQTSRTGAPSLNVVIDALIWYAFETGSLTCAGTIVSMLCYITMGNNLIFMGLHFVISKFYANSLLVTLNTRQTLRRSRSPPSPDREFPAFALDTRRVKRSGLSSLVSPASQDLQTKSKGYLGKLEISIERSVQYETESAPVSFRISQH